MPETVTIEPSEEILVDLQVRVKFPPGVVGILGLRRKAERAHRMRISNHIIGKRVHKQDAGAAQVILIFLPGPTSRGTIKVHVTNLQRHSKMTLKRGTSYMHLLPVRYSEATLSEAVTKWWSDAPPRPPPAPPSPPPPRPAFIPSGTPIITRFATANDFEDVMVGGGKTPFSSPHVDEDAETEGEEEEPEEQPLEEDVECPATQEMPDLPETDDEVEVVEEEEEDKRRPKKMKTSN